MRRTTFRRVLLPGLALLARAAIAQSAPALEAPPPRAAVRADAAEVDLGDLPSGSTPARDYRLTNHCDTAATLAVGHAPGLAVAGLPATLPPGGAVAVTVRALEPEHGAGEIARTVDLQIEPARCGPLTLEFHARLLQYFESEPRGLHLKLDTRPGREAAAPLRLYRKDGQPVVLGTVLVESLPRQPALCDNRLAAKGIATREGWGGELQWAPPAGPLDCLYRIRFPTDHPRQPEAIVTLLARALPPLNRFPGEVRFFTPVSRAKLAAGEPATRRVYLRAPSGWTAFTPGAIKIEPEFLSARWVTPEIGEALADEAVAEVSVSPEAPLGPFTGTLRVARSAEAGDDEVIAVSGTVGP